MRKEGTNRGRRIIRKKAEKGKQNCTGEQRERRALSKPGTLDQTEQELPICVRECAPAEDCPLIFGVDGEPDGLLASTCGDGLCGDRLTGCGFCLSFFLIAVGAAGGGAV